LKEAKKCKLDGSDDNAEFPCHEKGVKRLMTRSKTARKVKKGEMDTHNLGRGTVLVDRWEAAGRKSLQRKRAGEGTIPQLGKKKDAEDKGWKVGSRDKGKTAHGLE